MRACLLAVLCVAASLPMATFDLSSHAPASNDLAGRYYIRNRTRDFYNRATPQRPTPKAHQPSHSFSDTGKIGNAEEPLQLAGRYYIRNRTRDFYRRATPRGTGHIG
jgi:hypothetical protein